MSNINDQLSELVDRMTERQQRLFACDCAERILSIYEARFPTDNSLRQTIQVARSFAIGEASYWELLEARKAVEEVLNLMSGQSRQSENDPEFLKALYAAETVENATWDSSVSQAWETALLASSEPDEREWQILRAQYYLK